MLLASTRFEVIVQNNFFELNKQTYGTKYFLKYLVESTGNFPRERRAKIRESKKSQKGAAWYPLPQRYLIIPEEMIEKLEN